MHWPIIRPLGKSIWGKWPWCCTTTCLDNSIELWKDIIGYNLFSNFRGMPCHKRYDNTPPAIRGEGLKNTEYALASVIQDNWEKETKRVNMAQVQTIVALFNTNTHPFEYIIQHILINKINIPHVLEWAMSLDRHCWGYDTGTLSCSQVSKTHLENRHL